MLSAVSIHAKDMLPTPANEPILGELEPVLVNLMKGKGKDRDLSFADIYKDPALKKLIE